MSVARTAAGITALVLLAGCSGGPAAPGAGSPDREPGTGATVRSARSVHYVALGDSYTAAPLVPVTDLAGGCLRSNRNYPQRLAEQLGAALTDVSCGGATTDDLTGRQAVGGGRATVRPQVRAVHGGTDLVTVGIGGNDGGLFARLAARCIGPDRQPLRRCGALGTAVQEAAGAVVETGRRVSAALRAVRRAAPRAEVVLVGYPRLADAAHSCPGLPLSATDRSAVARIERRLDDVLGRAARAADARYVDVHAASRGHEICSDDPWVNGGLTEPERALAYHPFAVEQQAVADLLADLLADRLDDLLAGGPGRRR